MWEAPPWAAVQNENFTYTILLLVLQMDWFAFRPSDVQMLKNPSNWGGSPRGCGAKRTFHLHFFATSFADGLVRCSTVRYVNVKDPLNLGGSPRGCGAKRTFHLQFFTTSFADGLVRFSTVGYVNAERSMEFGRLPPRLRCKTNILLTTFCN